MDKDDTSLSLNKEFCAGTSLTGKVYFNCTSNYRQFAIEQLYFEVKINFAWIEKYLTIPKRYLLKETIPAMPNTAIAIEHNPTITNAVEKVYRTRFSVESEVEIDSWYCTFATWRNQIPRPNTLTPRSYAGKQIWTAYSGAKKRPTKISIICR